jgi:hypothetical protein
MGKAGRKKISAVSLFLDANKKKHPNLFLPKMLAEEAEKSFLAGTDRDHARQVLLQWADLADKGRLTHKETALDADFLEKIFGPALGYRSVSNNPEDFHREKQFSVPGAGTADGALGRFSIGKKVCPSVVIELKGAGQKKGSEVGNRLICRRVGLLPLVGLAGSKKRTQLDPTTAQAMFFHVQVVNGKQGCPSSIFHVPPSSMFHVPSSIFPGLAWPSIASNSATPRPSPT